MKWKAVKDGLPEADSFCLVCRMPWIKTHQATYHADTQAFQLNGGEYIVLDVTHYIEIPSPPYPS